MVYEFPPKRLPARRPTLHPRARPWNLDPSCVFCAMPEANTKWVDHSPSGLTGTLNGGTFKDRGRFGAGVEFNGAGNGTRFGDLSVLDQELSTEVWFMLDANPTNHSAILFIDLPDWSVTGGLRYYLSSASAFAMGMRNNVDASETGSDSVTLTHKKWYHGVITWKRPTAKFYLNGVLKKTTNWDHDIGWSTKSPYVGKFSVVFKGVVDEIRIYTRVLTAQEVANLYQQGRP